MKSTGTGLSLSLRLRMEGESSMNLSKKLEGGLPPVHSHQHSAHSSNPSNPVNQAPKSKTHVAAENLVKSKNIAARLSGTLSYTTGSTANLADRAQTIRPSACCVRCSVHASICMDCCDLQTQKAVAFYRRTLGKGASAILSEAIMQAGLGTMSKFVIFSLWKNGTHNRNLARDRKMREVTRQCNDKMMKAPLVAWRKFTKDEIISRKDLSIKELQAKVHLLENQIGGLVEAKETAQEAVGTVNDKLLFSVMINDDCIETIRVMKSDLADEKKRVISLAGLCEPILNSSSVLDSYGQGECNSFVDNLVDSGCNILTYDYSKVFNQASRDVILNAFSLREERKINPSTKTRYLIRLESEATQKMLLQWANYISRECVNSINEPTDDDDLFETLLPRHEQIYDFIQFGTGKTLSRVVFYLLYCGSHVTRDIIPPFSITNNDTTNPPTSSRTRAPSVASTPLKGRKASLSSSSDGRTPRRKSTDTPQGTPRSKYGSRKSVDMSNQPVHPLTIINQKKLNPTGFDYSHIAGLKDAEGDPKILIDLTLKYAAEFLSLPVYNSQDVIQGKKFEITTILGHLFLASSPTRDERDFDGIRELLLEYDDLSAHLSDLRGRLGYSTRSVKDIKESLKEYLTPLDVPEMNVMKRNSVSASKRGSIMSGRKPDFDPVLSVLSENFVREQNQFNSVSGAFNENTGDDSEKTGVTNNTNTSNTTTSNTNNNSGKLMIEVSVNSVSAESGSSSLIYQDDGSKSEFDEAEFEEQEPLVHIDYELIKYTKLQKVIDKLVNSNEINLLEDSVTAMTNNVKRLSEMRKNISNAQKKKNEGIRIATDVRAFVAKNVFQNLVTPLNLVVPET